MKTFKTFLTEKGITDEQFTALEAGAMAKLYNEYNAACFKSLQETVDGKANKTSIPNLDETLKGYVKESVLTDVNTQLKEALQGIATLKEGGKGAGGKLTLKQSIKAALLKNAGAIMAMKTDRNGSLQIKAVGAMTFGTNTTGRVGRQELDPETTGVARRNPFVMEIVNVGNTNAATYHYVERTNHEGGPTMTAEGAVKPQADWDYIERTATPKKIPVIVTVSKEMLADIDGITDDINNEIEEQIALVADNGLLVGDGVGTNLVGFDANATPFAAGALAGTVEDANKLDVLRAGVAQIYRQFYTPSFVVIHPDAAASMDLQKGTDGHYLLAPFTSADNMQVSGIKVITNTNVGIDDFYVGDFSKFKVKIREGLTIDVGYRGAADDWAKNFLSFLGEVRLSSYIPENNFGAIVKGDFTSATALLETP